MVPNAAAWLLPEFYDLANALNMVVDMPSILPHGTRIDTTSDGFLIWLPSCAHGPCCLLLPLTSCWQATSQAHAAGITGMSTPIVTWIRLLSLCAHGAAVQPSQVPNFGFRSDRPFLTPALCLDLVYHP